jgi:hypothetical protein
LNWKGRPVRAPRTGQFRDLLLLPKGVIGADMDIV